MTVAEAPETLSNGQEPLNGEEPLDPLQAANPEYCDEATPLSHYARIIALYHLAFAIFLVISKNTGKPIPERLRLSDIALLGVATFKLSRLISKEIITTPIRAPFTRFVEYTGQGEVKEAPRGEGAQRVAGELLSCPFCLGAWVSALMAYGLILSPPVTRLIASIFAMQVINDFMQLGYTSACGGTELVTAAAKTKDV